MNFIRANFRFVVLSLLAVGAIRATALPSEGEPTCAKNDIVLRKGPGAKFPVSWKAARFMPFMRQESKNGWVHVADFEGETHWAPARDLSSSLHCVVVRAQIATLRKEPSLTSAPAEIKTLDRYTALKKLEANGEWLKVEDESGHQAWIHESNVWKPAKVQSVQF